MTQDQRELLETANRILHEVSALFNDLNRNAIRLDEDWPEEEFQRVKELVDELLWPEEGEPVLRAAIEALDTSYHNRRLEKRLEDPEFKAEYDSVREDT